MAEQRRHKKTAENEQVIQSGLHTHTQNPKQETKSLR